MSKVIETDADRRLALHDCEQRARLHGVYGSDDERMLQSHSQSSVPRITRLLGGGTR